MRQLAVIAVAAGMISGSIPLACASIERPPQFVLMAFDNCTELDRWENLTKFVSDMKTKNISVQFTFFVSAINFLADKNRDVYTGPHHARGKSNIDFGGSPADIGRRVAFVNGLHAAGSEIASHNVGHFDGGQERWSAVDWRKESESYKALFLNVGGNNQLSDAKFDFSFDSVVGFRAPYLSTNSASYSTLSENKFRYDTSSDSGPTVWPAKKDGIWRFNLADLKIAGSGRRTLSMDFNFYATQSHAREDPKNYILYRQQMLDTYLEYFQRNYTGNRAPLHIGHHFAPYQGGMYHQALQAFAELVCGLPEVKCVTYTQLADFMDTLDQSTLEAYQRGDFPRAPDPGVATAVAFADAPPAILVQAGVTSTLNASLVGAQRDRYRSSNLAWFVNGRKIGEGQTVPVSRLPKGEVPLTVVYQSPDGQDSFSVTQRVRVVGRKVQSIGFHAELKPRTLKR